MGKQNDIFDLLDKVLAPEKKLRKANAIRKHYGLKERESIEFTLEEVERLLSTKEAERFKVA